MTARSLLLAAALLAACTATASAQDHVDAIAAPVHRASVSVTGDVVRIVIIGSRYRNNAEADCSIWSAALITLAFIS